MTDLYNSMMCKKVYVNAKNRGQIQVTVRLDPIQSAWLKSYATRNRLKKVDIVREALDLLRNQHEER